jgi:hypothetical protein
VNKPNAGVKDIVTSVIILVIQFGLVAYVVSLLFRGELKKLGTVENKSRIGNLYHNLDTRDRAKVLFGLIFFVQRTLIVLLLALC